MKWRILLALLALVVVAAFAPAVGAQSPDYCATAPDGPNCHLQREQLVAEANRAIGDINGRIAELELILTEEERLAPETA